MKITTFSLSPKECKQITTLVKTLHATHTCVMHKALHAYAKALRHKRIRKNHLRIVQLGSKTTMNFKDRMVLRGLLRGTKKPFTNALFERKMGRKRFVECMPHKKQPPIRTNKERIHQQEMESDKPFTNTGVKHV